MTQTFKRRQNFRWSNNCDQCEMHKMSLHFNEKLVQITHLVFKVILLVTRTSFLFVLLLGCPTTSVVWRCQSFIYLWIALSAFYLEIQAIFLLSFIKVHVVVFEWKSNKQISIHLYILTNFYIYNISRVKT